jgi:hypothetical protein
MCTFLKWRSNVPDALRNKHQTGMYLHKRREHPHNESPSLNVREGLHFRRVVAAAAELVDSSFARARARLVARRGRFDV